MIHRTPVKKPAELKIFTTRRNNEFALKVAESIGLSLGKVKIKDFADKEIWVKYNSHLRGDDVFIIGSTEGDPKHLIELLIMIKAAKLSTAWRVTAVIPCFGGRQDRRDQPRTCITARLYADLIETAGADRVITMDLHAPQIQGFFSIPVDHLFGSLDFCKYFSQKNITPLAIYTTDIGGIKMARKYKKFLNAEKIVIIDKDRPKHNETKVADIIEEAKEKIIISNALIVDDLLDTGNSFINAVDTASSQGCTSIYGWCPHGVLSGDAIERIQKYLSEGKLKTLMLGDTMPFNPVEGIEKVSVSKTFGEAILASFENRTVEHLFIENENEEDEIITND